MNSPGVHRLYWFLGWTYELTNVITILVCFGLTIHFLVLTVSRVHGTSMLPAYRDNQLLLVDRLSYRFSPVKRGDAVVFFFPTSTDRVFVKRVVGLPGEKVFLRQSDVWINDQPLLIKYRQDDIGVHTDQEYSLGADEYYVLGDAHDLSLDSRIWGGLPRRYIFGKVITLPDRIDVAGLIERAVREAPPTFERFFARFRKTAP